MTGVCGPNLEDIHYSYKGQARNALGRGEGYFGNFMTGVCQSELLAQFYESGPILIGRGSSDWAVCGPNLEDTPYSYKG